MSLAELAKGIVHRKIRYADMDFGMNTLIVGVVQQSNIHSDLVEDLEHLRRSIGEEVCQDGLRGRKVVI